MTGDRKPPRWTKPTWSVLLRERLAMLLAPWAIGEDIKALHRDQPAADVRHWEIVVMVGPCTEIEADVVFHAVSELVSNPDFAHDVTVAMRPYVGA